MGRSTSFYPGDGGKAAQNDGIYFRYIHIPSELGDKSLNPYLDTSHLSTVSYFVKFLFLLSLEHGENRSRIGFITQNMETVGRTLKKSGLAGLYFIWSRAKWRVSCHCHLTSPPES
jgi:hypothetical protein